MIYLSHLYIHFIGGLNSDDFQILIQAIGPIYKFIFFIFKIHYYIYVMLKSEPNLTLKRILQPQLYIFKFYTFKIQSIKVNDFFFFYVKTLNLK